MAGNKITKQHLYAAAFVVIILPHAIIRNDFVGWGVLVLYLPFWLLTYIYRKNDR